MYYFVNYVKNRFYTYMIKNYINNNGNNNNNSNNNNIMDYIMNNYNNWKTIL